MIDLSDLLAENAHEVNRLCRDVNRLLSEEMNDLSLAENAQEVRDSRREND